jgi:molybdate transport system substrate-binding protein
VTLLQRFPFHGRRATATLLAAGFLLAGCGSGSGVTVYAASSLTSVLEEAARQFTDDTGIPVDLRFGSSGFLAVELEHGAPADVFISASVEWTDRLRDRDLLDRDSETLLAWNRLVVVVPNSALASVPRNPTGLPILEHIAIGDPESVPVGMYAAQALKQEGAWDVLQGHLVETHDARAALALVERREAEGGIVYASDARQSTSVKIAFEFPDQVHDPIVYPAAILAAAPHPEAAGRWLRFLSGPAGRDLFRAHGFQGN